MDNAEIEVIQSTWKLVAPEPATHGVEILVRLFEKYPETKDFFKRLNVGSPEEMRANARVKAHGARVVGALGGIVAQLNDMELVDETIFLLGENHQKRNITGAEFEKISEIIVAYMKDALGDNFSAEAEAAYVKMLGVFTKKISQHL